MELGTTVDCVYTTNERENNMNHDLAVIIPTHNRCAMLVRMLGALAAQTYSTDRFEVVVVCDGCTDDTYTTLQSLATPFRLHVVDQPSAGPAGARNRGVTQTNARVVLFLDDDILPAPTLLAEHMRGHDTANCVVVGRLLPDKETPLAGWTRWEQRTWDRRYAAIERGAIAASGQHVYSGNVSVDRALFVRLGGFNTTLKRAEDTELGYRLQRAGAQFRFNGSAAGVHCGVHSFTQWQTIQYTYGRSDVRLADREGHAALLPLAQWYGARNLLNRVVIRATIGRLALQKLILLVAQVCARACDRVALHRLGHWSYSVIANVLYWQGVADELGGTEQLWDRVAAPSTTRSVQHA